MEEPQTLEALRRQLAPAIADAAAFDGWSVKAVDEAARLAGVDPELARYAFAEGQMAMISAWIAHVDAEMARSVPAASLAGLPIRERIRRLVMARLDAVAGREEALSRALAVMAMPRNVLAATRLGWHSADAMWRLAGDTATDYNHYTKRAILGAIYAATLKVFASDTSEDAVGPKAETRAFLDRRIEGIMRFEKAKAQWLRPSEERISLVRLMGRLRYPAR
ncbi:MULTISPECIES: COQ9 family protein [Sphingomonadaceae]|uniref:COQ9 family protein n=1 Tax=Sphingomonadaceae TaxID=41297 RepID=UPI00115C19D7|nr:MULTISPECIES: COQ9 family protein [Sphingomonadaceae]QDK31787.1 COQ9 family protein [Sphingomonas sp. IC081]QSR15981.1 RpsU-divergently transcribed [Novosphingobium sp. KA1]